MSTFVKLPDGSIKFHLIRLDSIIRVSGNPENEFSNCHLQSGEEFGVAVPLSAMEALRLIPDRWILPNLKWQDGWKRLTAIADQVTTLADLAHAN